MKARDKKMNYKSFNLGDWIGHISGAIEDERELDGNEMRDLVEFLTTLNKEPIFDKIRVEIADLDDTDYDYEGYYKAITDALQIIDKYKADMESEE